MLKIQKSMHPREIKSSELIWSNLTLCIIVIQFFDKIMTSKTYTTTPTKGFQGHKIGKEAPW